MAEIIDIEKTRPIRVLDSRRDALLKWLAEGQQAIKVAEALIKTHQEQAIEIVAEIDEIDAALNALYKEQKQKEREDVRTDD